MTATPLFSADQIVRLKADFPLRDVDRIVAEVERKSLTGSVTSPLGLARAWLKRAEAQDDHKLLQDASGASGVAQEPGGFMPDGSWSTHGHDPTMTKFVDMLVTARRRGYTITRIAERILAEPETQGAFPLVEEWKTLSDWRSVPSRTSAERCVIDGGYGPGGAERLAGVVSDEAS